MIHGEGLCVPHQKASATPGASPPRSKRELYEPGAEILAAQQPEEAPWLLLEGGTDAMQSLGGGAS